MLGDARGVLGFEREASPVGADAGTFAADEIREGCRTFRRWGLAGGCASPSGLPPLAVLSLLCTDESVTGQLPAPMATPFCLESCLPHLEDSVPLNCSST